MTCFDWMWALGLAEIFLGVWWPPERALSGRSLRLTRLSTDSVLPSGPLATLMLRI